MLPADVWTARMGAKWGDRTPRPVEQEQGPALWIADGESWGFWSGRPMGFSGPKPIHTAYDRGGIEDLTELRVIILAGNFITDISPLKKLEKLEYAELFNNYIEDYSPLSGLENLIDLNICFNQTQDFTPLYGLKGLERLWVYNSNNRNSDDPVSPELVADLQAQLPQCQINSTSYSTAGGWRTHERYYVVFNMLHGAVAWLPWHAEGLVPRYN